MGQDIVTEEEYGKVMAQLMEDAHPRGLTDAEWYNQTRTVVSHIRELKLNADLYSLWSKNMVSMHLNSEGEVVYKITEQGRKEAEEVENAPSVSQLEQMLPQDQEEPVFSEDKEYSLTPEYWIDQFFKNQMGKEDEVKSLTRDFVMYLAEHGLYIEHMNK